MKAYRLIQQCDLVTYLSSDRGYSLARTIATDALNQNQPEHAIVMPMADNRDIANRVYDDAATVIAESLDQGKNVVFLCQGDPFFFGSFSYLYDRLSDNYSIEVVPGISSINASAALSGKPLGLLAENIAIISGRRSNEEILHTLQTFDNIAIMKPGRRRPDILKAIKQAGRAGDTCYIEYASQKNQKIIHNIERLDDNQTGPYFSLFLINKSRDYGSSK